MDCSKGLFAYLGLHGDKGFCQGVPIETQRKILWYMDAPSLDAWKAVRDLIIHSMLTLHDLVDRVDRDYRKFPSAILIARALKERQKVGRQLHWDSPDMIRYQ